MVRGLHAIVPFINLLETRRWLFSFGAQCSEMFLLALAGMALPAPRASAQSVIFCPIGSSGAQYAFGSWTTCPLPGALAVSSFLNGYDDWGYYNITATFSGCTCDWDYAFTNYSLGSGNYQAQGYHTANIPGYYPSAGYTFYYFSV